MLPKLAIVYNQATLPLQLMASRLAATILTTLGAGVIRDGNVLQVGDYRVAVAEACNGIRYLLPLAFTGVVFAYLADPKPWMRIAVLLGAIPLAIGANAVRVAASAWVPVLSTGTPHATLGWAIFAACFVGLILFHRILSSVHARYHA